MAKGIIYKDSDSLQVMETLEDKSFDMIYLDVPYFTSKDSFCYQEPENIRKSLSKQKGCPIGDITIEEVTLEKQRIEQDKLQKYSEYISHIIENAYRLLSDNGILCFLSPSTEYVDINYRLILDQFFKSSMNVTLERRIVNATISKHRANNDVLYFYSKQIDFEFPELKELGDIKDFPFRDDFDYYRKALLTIPKNMRDNSFVWQGITLSENQSWRYSKEKMDSLFAENRIEVANGKAFLKCYRGEHLRTVSSVWENEDIYMNRSRISVGSKCFERMFNICLPNGGKVFCPFDRDGKFCVMANSFGLEWTSVYIPMIDEDRSLLLELPKGTYSVIDVVSSDKTISYSTDIVTNVSEIKKLQEKVNSMLDNIHKIQSSIGMDETDEIAIDEVIEQIHKQTMNFAAGLDIDGYIPAAKEWIDPCWERLEESSKCFIPTGILFSSIASLFSGDNKMEMTPIVIEYCKTLENELFQKIFFGYIENMISREVNVKRKFANSFSDNDAKVFAKFMNDCTWYNKTQPSEWHLEIGKMIKILTFALDDNVKDELFKDFRSYLDDLFEKEFFNPDFIKNLDTINLLRNDCAHKTFVDKNRANSGKTIIREKLLNILKNYKR